MNIYVLDLSFIEKEYTFSDRIINMLSKYKKELFLRVLDRKKAISVVFSELIIYYSIYKEYGTRSFEIYRNQYGKPYVNIPNFFFNLSHSNNMIVLASSSENVGIDIEFFKKRDISFIKSFFSIEEQNYIVQNSKSLEAFYRVWTMKESYVKMLGIGLNENFRNFNVLNNLECNFRSFYDINNYIYTVCSEKNNDINKISVKTEDILQYFNVSF